MITIDNYEEYLVMHADGELQPHEEEALRVFLNDHPHLEEDLSAYRQARLIPDETIIYTQKESLVKPEPKRGIIFMPGWRALSIAAGIAAIILITFAILRDGNNTEKPAVVNNNNTVVPGNSKTGTASTPTDPQPDIADTTNNRNDVAVQPANNAADNSDNSKNAPIPVNHPNKSLPGVQQNNTGSATKDVLVKNDKKTPVNEAAPGATRPVYMTAVAAADFKKLPVTAAPANTAGNVPVESYSMTAAAPEAVKSWIDKLPLNDEKKEQLNTIANAVAYGIDKATDFKNNVGDKKLTVKVEKRRLILSF